MIDFNGYRVRQASDSDIPSVVALEAQAYGNIGTDQYGEEHVRAWLETCPEFLLIAEKSGAVVGYASSQRIDFSFDRLAEIGSYDELTDHGTFRATHRPDGCALHTVNLASVERGAGMALIAASLVLGASAGMRYILACARMPGLDAWLKAAEASGKPDASLPLETLALWYALETARLCGGAIWPCLTERPVLDLPPLAEADPVVRKQLSFAASGLAAVRTRFMKDPQSRDCNAILVADMPAAIKALGF